MKKMYKCKSARKKKSQKKNKLWGGGDEEFFVVVVAVMVTRVGRVRRMKECVSSQPFTKKKKVTQITDAPSF